MATNIVDALKQRLGSPELQKVDPNVQQIKNDGPHPNPDLLEQASVSGVLAAFFRLSRSDEGSRAIISGGSQTEWLDKLFGDNKNQAVENVAHFSGVSTDAAAHHLQHVAKTAAMVILENTGDAPTEQKVKAYLSGERHHILVYLPAALNWGELLNDGTLDDKTNKMEGPMSNMISSIENLFSGGGGK